MPVVLAACRNGGIYLTFSMEKCGNLGVWVLSRDLAIGSSCRIYPAAAAPAVLAAWQELALPAMDSVH